MTKRYVVIVVGALLMFLSFLSSHAYEISPRVSIETGKIRLLYIGVNVNSESSFRYLLMDPFFEVAPVQAHQLYDDSEVKRSVRVYMPRTYVQMISELDVIYMVYPDRRAFTSNMITWFTDSVIEDGLGLSIVARAAGIIVTGYSPVSSGT